MAEKEVAEAPKEAKKDKCPPSIANDPNFAVVCHFIERFGQNCGVQCPNIRDLQEMLEDTKEVRKELIAFQVRLLRKLKKSVSFDRWERSLVKYAHTYSEQDGWEMERFTYRNTKPSTN